MGAGGTCRKGKWSRHDPTTPDATPLSPDARRDTTNVRLKLRAMPSVRSFIISQIWNLQRLVSPRQPRLYPVSPHYRKPQYRNDITSRLSLSLDIAPFPLSLRLYRNDIISRLSLSLDIVPFPLSLRLFLNSEVTPHFPPVASSLLHRRDTVPPLTKISNKDLPIILHMPLHTLAYTVCGRFHIPGSYRSLIPVFASRNVTLPVECQSRSTQASSHS